MTAPANAITTVLDATESGPASALALMIIGMVVVFGALSVIALLIALSSRLFAERRPAGETGPKLPPAAEDELIAVLTAAATAALRRPARVHRVRMLGLTGREHWVAEGRIGIMTSHRIHRRKDQ